MPEKIGFDYYPCDTDRYQDKKIKRLKNSFKCDGLSTYDYILSEVYRVQGCFLVWDEDTAFDVAEYLGLKETTVNEIVNYCCHVGLFNKELFASGRIITSRSIQRRYTEMCAKAKRKNCQIPEFALIIPEVEAKIPEVEPEIPPFENKEKKRKVKKRKENTEPPSLADVRSYFDENGYTQESADKFFKYYETANWHDSKGNPVKSWKQKSQAVWFKDENKKTEKPGYLKRPQLQNNEW